MERCCRLGFATKPLPERRPTLKQLTLGTTCPVPIANISAELPRAVAGHEARWRYGSRGFAYVLDQRVEIDPNLVLAVDAEPCAWRVLNFAHCAYLAPS